MSTERALVLTVIGEDRPGLVDALSDVVARHGGSWEESRMARLAGHFAGILQVRIPEEHAEALVADLPGLVERGLRAHVVDSDLPMPTAELAAPLRLELVCQDRAGIVREIAAALAGLGVNVLELHTSVESAPMSGEPLFRAQARIQLPAGLGEDQVRERLERIASDLVADLVLGGTPSLTDPS